MKTVSMKHNALLDMARLRSIVQNLKRTRGEDVTLELLYSLIEQEFVPRQTVPHRSVVSVDCGRISKPVS